MWVFFSVFAQKPLVLSRLFRNGSPKKKRITCPNTNSPFFPPWDQNFQTHDLKQSAVFMSSRCFDKTVFARRMGVGSHSRAFGAPWRRVREFAEHTQRFPQESMDEWPLVCLSDADKNERVWCACNYLYSYSMAGWRGISMWCSWCLKALWSLNQNISSCVVVPFKKFFSTGYVWFLFVLPCELF